MSSVEVLSMAPLSQSVCPVHRWLHVRFVMFPQELSKWLLATCRFQKTFDGTN